MRALAQRAYEKFQRGRLWNELSIFAQDELVGFAEAVAAELEDDAADACSCTECDSGDAADGRCPKCLAETLRDALTECGLGDDVIDSVVHEVGL